MNPILVGMNNPYGSDQKYALYPLPERSAGGHLYGMIHEAIGLTRHQYLKSFDRMNLVDGPWSASEARKRASELRCLFTDRRVILLGRQVQEAFGFKACNPLSRMEGIARILPRSFATFYIVPHPSGLNLWYNVSENRDAVKKLFAELYARV